MSMQAEQQHVALQPSFEIAAGSSPAAAVPNPDQAIAGRTRTFDTARLRKQFADQGAFLYLDDFLAPEVTAQLVSSARGLLDEVNRNYLPGHKQGGSVSRHTIDRLAPFIADLYRSKELIGWLEQMRGDKLQL